MSACSGYPAWRRLPARMKGPALLPGAGRELSLSGCRAGRAFAPIPYAGIPSRAGHGRRASLRHMRRQRMVGGLVEERGFLCGRVQQLLVLVIDVVAELHGLV